MFLWHHIVRHFHDAKICVFENAVLLIIVNGSYTSGIGCNNVVDRSVNVRKRVILPCFEQSPEHDKINKMTYDSDQPGLSVSSLCAFLGSLGSIPSSSGYRRI